MTYDEDPPATVPPGDNRAWVYSHGLLYASVCAKSEEDALRRANFSHPTGLDHGWAVANEPFRTGEPNPTPCPDNSARSHWLFVC